MNYENVRATAVPSFSLNISTDPSNSQFSASDCTSVPHLANVLTALRKIQVILANTILDKPGLPFFQIDSEMNPQISREKARRPTGCPQ